MSNNRTNRGVLILASILALILGTIFLTRRHRHPLDAEAELNPEVRIALPVDSVSAADSVKPKITDKSKKSDKVKKSAKSKKSSSSKRKTKQPAADLPSPHDAPVSLK